MICGENVDSNLYWVWFHLASEKFRAKSRKLYKKAGSIEKIYSADIGQYVSWGITDIRYLKILCDKNLDAAKKELWYAENYNTEIISHDSKKYPEKLKNLSDFPLVIYKRGKDGFKNDGVSVAIVGTREATAEGKNLAYEIAFSLAKKGVRVISGMAAGIDTCAHLGALDAEGETIAVFGCSVATAFPASNKGLMQRIAKNGCIYSEYGFEQAVYPSNFSDRNRIVSAMSDAVVVIETGKSSGSLITARLAHKQGKKLFVSKLALSGNGGENLFEGIEINVIESAEDILEYLGIEHSSETAKEKTAQTESMPEDLPDDDRRRRNKILDFLKQDAAYDEEIADNIGENPVETGILLTLMEIESLIIRRPDGKYTIND